MTETPSFPIRFNPRCSYPHNPRSIRTGTAAYSSTPDTAKSYTPINRIQIFSGKS